MAGAYEEKLSYLPEDLAKKTQQAVNSLYFDVSVPDEMIEPLQQVYRHWLTLQKQINKDQICNQIVNSLRDKIPFNWSHCNLSIVDEAWIQKTLRDNHVEIRCHGLDVFPTNTEDFLPLLFKEKK
jgi:hypothetical protein